MTAAPVPGLLPARVNRAAREVLGAAAPSDVAPAALQVLATVPRWWQQQALASGLSAPWTDVFFAVDAVPLTTVEVPWRRDLLDVSAHALGEAYVGALDSDVRSRTGRHYTPEALAEALWRQVKDLRGDRVAGLTLDPACGAGALLLPVLRDWLRQEAGTPANQILDQVVGIVAGRDLDPAAVWLGSVLLAAELLPTLALVPEQDRQPLPALLVVADGLDTGGVRASNVILNPPYGRVRLDPEDRAVWSEVLHGHANRYYLHVAAAVQQVNQGGVVAALIPAGWLGGSYAQNLRGYLAERAPLRRLTYVRDRTGVFSTDVTQETVLAGFVVGDTATEVLSDRVYLQSDAAVQEQIGVTPGLSGTQPVLLPRTAADVPLVGRAQQMTARLATYGWHVSTGPLVWNRHKAALSARPRKTSVRVVWAADIDGGRLHQDQRRNAMRYVEVQTHEQATLVLDRPAVLVQRTTSSEQARRVIAASLTAEDLKVWKGRVVVENHVNVLTCSDPDSVLTPRVLTALLDSLVVDRLYRCLSGSVAVSAYELEALPLPDEQSLRDLRDLDPDLLPDAVAALYRPSGDDSSR